MWDLIVSVPDHCLSFYLAYKGLVGPVQDYGSSIWDTPAPPLPPGVVLQEELESVQKREARFVTGNYGSGSFRPITKSGHNQIGP